MGAVSGRAGHCVWGADVSGVMHSSESVEWYTPREFVDAAREVMGSIELDPASCEEANRTVRAERFYTSADDGYRLSWKSQTLWCNPPYGKEGGKSLQARWAHRLIDEWRAGYVKEACLLVNATTGNKWFAPLWAFPMCFVESRIHFVAPAASGLKNQPTHSSVVVYLGHNDHRFAKVFGRLGHVVLPLQVVASMPGSGVLL